MTPEPVIDFFWKITRRYRRTLGSVLDLGAGDCRFAEGGHFGRYFGVEIDRRRAARACVPPNGKLHVGCAFKLEQANFEACIGNPPYARHHDLRPKWKNRTVAALERELDHPLHRNANLYIHFLCLGILKSTAKGLVSMVVPYEWVSRPSARALRGYILKQGWHVDVYRFCQPVFEDVLTTASVSVIDKAGTSARWRYFDVGPEFRVTERTTPTPSSGGVLGYSIRGAVWALRGLSPGSQKVFTLTEGERIRAGLRKSDVVPCVTTLRTVSPTLRILTRASFEKHFVTAGRKCWLICSHRVRRSKRLDSYLEAVPPNARSNFTCRHQDPWFRYRPHPVPQLLFGSGFTTFGPKVLLNPVGARAVGSVWGIHSKKRVRARELQRELLRMNFERRIVPHARTLKKVEVRQLNGVLNSLVLKGRRNGNRGSR